MSHGVRNILTFDVEDWPQSTLDSNLPITTRVRDNTARILDLLAESGVRATFFVLGLVAEHFPDVVRRIGAAGHEVASHGGRHLPVSTMSPAQFRDDLRTSLRLIENAAGLRVRGFRAPDFSIRPDGLWALSIMAEEGLEYDSSLFPFSGPRYGVPQAFRTPCLVRCPARSDFVEFPLTTLEIFGVRLPAAGGGYFRLLPYGVTRCAIRRLNRAGFPSTTYFHPYEADVRELDSLGYPVPLRTRLSQGFLRSRVTPRLRRLLHDFAWGPVEDWLVDRHVLAGSRLLDLTGVSGRPSRWSVEAGP